jgi:nucleotide-binding universal stress UspA family protein
MLPIHRILHPTDFSERSSTAFQLACALAHDYGARLVVLHVAQPPMIAYGEVVMPPPSLDYRKVAEDQLRQLQAPWAGLRLEHRLEEGDPAATILRVAQETGSDLVVLGTHGRTGLGRLLMGSVAEQVVRRAPCAVLTVKTPFPGAGPPESALQEEEVKGGRV